MLHRTCPLLGARGMQRLLRHLGSSPNALTQLHDAVCQVCTSLSQKGMHTALIVSIIGLLCASVKCLHNCVSHGCVVLEVLLAPLAGI